MPLGLLIPLNTGEGIGTSVEIGRLDVDDQSLGSLFQETLGIIEGSDQFDKRRAQGANDVWLPPLDYDVSHTAYVVNVETSYCLWKEIKL